MKPHGRRSAAWDRAIILGRVLAALLSVLVLASSSGCGDDLPPGILPGVVISYEPTHITSGVATGPGTTGTLSLTNISPANPVAGTTITAAGQGFTPPVRFGPNLQGTASTMQFSYLAYPEAVLTVQQPSAQPSPAIGLDIDDVPSSVLLRVELDERTANGAVSLIKFAPLGSDGLPDPLKFVRSNQVQLTLTPRITRLASGSFTPGTTFAIGASGVALTLADNKIVFLDSAGQEAGRTTPLSIDFRDRTPPSGGTFTREELSSFRRPRVLVAVPATLPQSPSKVALVVGTLTSASFP